MSDNFAYEKGREAGIAWGERLERDRIIALIEPFAQCDECEAGGKSDDCSPKLAQYIIDSILRKNDD